MSPDGFVGLLAVALGSLVAWGCRTLPAEGWQILAVLPRAKEGAHRWAGTNLTWYGALTATGYTLAVAMALVLLASVGVPLLASGVLAAAVLAACVPASRLVARLVEKKRHGFTVGGAAFVGTILGPWLVLAVRRVGAVLGWSVPLAPSLTALALAYAYGEGVGRLACVSFGCCYGKAVAEAHPVLRGAFARVNFVFAGETKKIAYASGLDGQRVIPVQGLTAALYVAAALLGTSLYLHGRYGAALVLVSVVTHGWRAASEVLRADWRGAGTISAYQWMAMAGAAYCLGVAAFLPAEPAGRPVLAAGLRALWNPGVVLALQALWLAVFAYVGRSTVTGSSLSFHVRRDRI